MIVLGKQKNSDIRILRKSTPIRLEKANEFMQPRISPDVLKLKEDLHALYLHLGDFDALFFALFFDNVFTVKMQVLPDR